MESLNSLLFFVQAAELRSFSEAARKLGVSSSTIGKSISRLEERLGVQLFHRSTRIITLTAEGILFLERCRRILCELEAAELELSETRTAPQGRLRISLPLVGMLVMPTLNAFMHSYPAIELDVDFSDHMVEVIEDGFDAVMRSGELNDSRLMARTIGTFKHQLVASPHYLAKRGTPKTPNDLLHHSCLQHKFPSTGKFETWPLNNVPENFQLSLPTSMICNTSAALLEVVTAGLGIACLPDFMVNPAIEKKELVVVLPSYTTHQGTFSLLWPASKHVAPKLRVFIDFMVENLFPHRR